MNSMKNTLAVTLVLMCCALPLQARTVQQETPHKPRLTILIGLDQFGAGYLEKYNHLFTGGFRRLLDQGAWYTNAMVDHAPTLSLPGHTTLATGANPSTHGITSNAWLAADESPDANGLLHATVPHLDRDMEIVGDADAMAFSPHHVRVEGIANWFRQADPDARTVALSVTPLAVLYGGKFTAQSNANHVYWMDSKGKFVTSNYYRDNYPDWIDEFNDSVAEKYLAHHVWEISVPSQYHGLARNDEADYEFDGVHTQFPHRAEEMITEVNDDGYKRWFGRFSPYQNDALFELARVAIAQLKLGQRDAVDFLSIAVKLTDRIGHDFGPESLEQLDVIYRLDRLLEKFFDDLDITVGKGNYLVGLSSDHGAPNISEYELAQGTAALRISSEDFEQALEAVEVLVNNHVGDERQLPELIARRLEQFPFVFKAMTRKDLQNGNDEDPLIHAYRNSFLPEQPTTYPLWTRSNRYGNLVTTSHPANYGVSIELFEYSNIWAARSTHGSSYSYDRRVPILLMGAGVKAGIATDQVFTRDLAPTLAGKSGVEHPGSVDGKMLKGLSRK
jgi:predicted AlkP superfamily pyrophosphatase or phosphodiesterase